MTEEGQGQRTVAVSSKAVRPNTTNPKEAGSDMQATTGRQEQGAGYEEGSRSAMRRALHWSKRGLQVAVRGVLTLVIMGAIYQAVATEIDQRQPGPAAGETVSDGDDKLSIRCMRQGGPRV